MNVLIAIFGQLGIDSSIFIQMGIIVFVFFVAHFGFLDKLKFVIESRLSKTEKLQQEANQKASDAANLADIYNKKIQASQHSTLEEILLAKKEMIKQTEKEMRELNGELQRELDKTRVALQADYEQRLKALNKDVDELSHLLVSKLTE